MSRDYISRSRSRRKARANRQIKSISFLEGRKKFGSVDNVEQKEWKQLTKPFDPHLYWRRISLPGSCKDTALSPVVLLSHF